MLACFSVAICSLVGIIEGGEDLAEAKWVTANCKSGITGCTGSGFHHIGMKDACVSKRPHACM